LVLGLAFWSPKSISAVFVPFILGLIEELTPRGVLFNCRFRAVSNGLLRGIAEGHFVCACSLEGTFNEENRWYAPPKKTNGDRRE